MTFITVINTKAEPKGGKECENQNSGIDTCHGCAWEDKNFEENPARNNILICISLLFVNEVIINGLFSAKSPAFQIYSSLLKL